MVLPWSIMRLALNVEKMRFLSDTCLVLFPHLDVIVNNSVLILKNSFIWKMSLFY